MRIGARNLKLIHVLFKDLAKRYGSHIAVEDNYCGYTATYKQLYNDIMLAAAGIQSLGLEKGMHVAQFSENCSRWLVLDQAIFNCGAVNAVRGSLAPIDELKYIYEQSDSVALITDSIKVIDGLNDLLNEKSAKFVIYLGNQTIQNTYNFPVYNFDNLLELGKNETFSEIEIKNDDIATLIYSSGTTGKPKGVMLTHENIASQLPAAKHALDLKETKTLTAVLPIWHAYERTCEYYIFSIGSRLCYTNIKNFKKDLQVYKPHYLIAVPRIYEAIYDAVITEVRKKSTTAQKIINFFIKSSTKRNFSKRILEGTCIMNQSPTLGEKVKHRVISSTLAPIDHVAKNLIYSKFKQALGGRYIKGISGGGALARHIDDFFLSVGIEVLVGYGLTETSPILSVRPSENNKAYSVGPAFLNTEFLVVNQETLQPVPVGQKGVVLARGPQVMKGYYKDPENTKKVKLSNGFLNTGDIGWMTNDGYLVLTGRSKDIIVLSNGENIEPEAIEQSCMTSPFVKQVVIAGQDKNALSALIVPNMEAIKELANKKNLGADNPLKCNELKNEILKELRERVQNRKTFRSHERLANFDFVEEEFTPENGLMTMTAKIKKNEVYERYREKIEAMYK